MHAIRSVPETSGDTEINLTPMLDVVFIMLVFFIVTATFVRDRVLPLASTNASDASPDPSGVILIEIDAADRFRVGGRAVDRALLRANLVRLHSLQPDRAVVITPDYASSTETLVYAIDAARLAQIADVAVAGYVSRRR